MNKEKWDMYIQRELVEKTNPGMSELSRRDDINFVNNFIHFDNKEVLDIGCEDGRILKYLKEKFGSKIHGVTLGKIKEGNDFIKNGDMHELPFEDSSMDVVLTMHTLEHSIAPYIALHEIKRVLKPGGKVVIIMPEEGDMWTTVSQHYSVMTFRQLFNLLFKLRFTNMRNFRKEYSITIGEAKRDIFSIWENTKDEPIKITEQADSLIPCKGNPIIASPGLTLTPIFIQPLVTKYDIGNHYFGRTDSLT